MASYSDSAALAALAPLNAGKENARSILPLVVVLHASLYSGAIGLSAKDGSQAMPKITLALLPFFLLSYPPASLFPAISILRTQIIFIENLNAAFKRQQ
jgi:hypothetical protein